MSHLRRLTDEQMARLQRYVPKSHGRQRDDDRMETHCSYSRLDSSEIIFYTLKSENYVEDNMPDAIALILENPLTIIVARVLLTLLFWMAGLFGVFNFPLVLREMEEAGLRFPRTCAVAMIICQLVGSALIITNVYGLGWLGAGALGVFTLLSIPLGHPFWKFEEPRKTHEFQIALEHVTVVGGLLMAAILSY